MALPPGNITIQQSQQITSQNPTQATQAVQVVEIDPIAKVKQLLLPRLKESLVVCILKFRSTRTSFRSS